MQLSQIRTVRLQEGPDGCSIQDTGQQGVLTAAADALLSVPAEGLFSVSKPAQGLTACLSCATQASQAGVFAVAAVPVFVTAMLASAFDAPALSWAGRPRTQQA